MKPRTLVLSDMPLKSFLHLFDAAAPLRVAALGDTMHPSSGYVDEAIVAGVETVGQLLQHEYDFTGLVYLEAVIEQVAVVYHESRYELSGDEKRLTRIENRLRELPYQATYPHVSFRPD